MENSKKQRQNKKINERDSSLSQQVSSFLSDVFSVQNSEQVSVQPILTIALSGGLDSCVLLHVLAGLRQSMGFLLTAHHVHHGLSIHADAWAYFCQTRCKQLNIPLIISTVNVDSNSCLGVEAAARKARYAALMNQNTGFVCTAHHQDDQAETLLLQLARGAGVKGLAAMAPMDAKRKLLRPLLNTSRTTLESYAKQYQLAWVDDESNLNQQFDRNFMRHSVLPILTQQYPAIKQNLARTAVHLAEAKDLLDELAQQDAKACFNAGLAINTLLLSPLVSLSQSRINNVLRWWLAQNHVRMPSTNQLQQITQQLFNAKSDASIKIRVTQENSSHDDEKSPELMLRRYQHCAYLVTQIIANVPINAVWKNEPVVHLTNQNYLSFSQVLGDGFAIKHLNNKQLTIKNRVGGERFKPDLNRPSRSLKAVLQTSNVPPWQREQLPLIYLYDTLAIIPNIGVDAHLKAAANEMGLLVSWHAE
jgi:tRNA(Ile)-lysidine synthase